MTEKRSRATGLSRAMRVVPVALALAGLFASTLAAEVAAAGPRIEIRDFWFYPPTVEINTGQSVTWVNVGDVVHDVMPLDGGFKASPPIKPGKRFTARFLKPGTYRFVDSTYREFMTGTIVVTGKPVTVAAPATPKPTAKPAATARATPKPTSAAASPTDSASAEASPSPTDVLTGAAGAAGGAGGAGGSGAAGGARDPAARLPGASESGSGFFGVLGVLCLAALIGLLLAGWAYIGRSRSRLEPATAAVTDAGAATSAVPSTAPAPARLPRWIERNRGANPYTAGATARRTGSTGDAATIPPGAGATVAAVGGERGLWTEEWDPVRPIAPEPAPDHDDSDLWEI